MKILKLSCSSSKWSETEKEIGEIICDLYRVCLLSSIPFSWKCKRKRSSIQNKVSPSPNKRFCTFNGGGTVVLKGEQTSSPATPFSFPTFESEEKIKHSEIKISLKKKKKSSLKTIEDLTKTKTLLNQEIENVKIYYDQLKIFNLSLKLKKQELLCKSNLENQPKVQLDNEVNGLVNTSESTAEKKEQQNRLQNNGPSSTGLGQNINRNNNCPIAFPAPNLPLDETMANKAIIATQARQRRLNIIRLRKENKEKKEGEIRIENEF